MTVIINLPRKNWKVVKPSPWLILWAAILCRFDLARIATVATAAGSRAAFEDLTEELASWPDRLVYAVADLLTPKVRFYAC